jgi:hypothetical protein
MQVAYSPKNEDMADDGGGLFRLQGMRCGRWEERIYRRRTVPKMTRTTLAWIHRARI